MMLAAVQSGEAPNVPALVCQTVLAIGGVAALVWIIRRARREAPTGVEPWRASLLDFGIWVWLIGFAYYIGITLLRFFYPAVTAQPAKGENILLLGCVMQLSVLGAQLGLIRSKRSFSPVPVNRVSLPARRVVGEGALAFLATFPIIMVTSLAWQYFLKLVQGLWTTLETPVQEPVSILAHSSSLTEKLLVIVFAVLIAPVAEELFFRAGVYRFLKSRLPAVAALGVASFLFALFHFNLGSFLPLFVLGTALAKLYERTGNIASPIVLHLLFNLVQILLMFLFPDSTVTAQPSP